MSETLVCCVCGDGVDESNSADCNFCQEPYHLRLRNDSDDKDCGEVWISSEHQALEFGCFGCLGVEDSEESPAEPSVGGGH